MKSRNQREGKFTGHSQRQYPKLRDGGERCVYVHHRFRVPANHIELMRRAMSLNESYDITDFIKELNS